MMVVYLLNTLSLSTVSPVDYDTITDEILDFPLGQTRVCFSININDDDTCEMETIQSFFPTSF